MSNVLSAIQNTVPISQFNRGLAGKIFEDVKTTGSKVVMKNNAAECVLVSPEEYVHLIDELNDAKLEIISLQRLADLNTSSLISEEDVWKRLNITQAELDALGEVEFE